MEVKFISPEETRTLRHRVLWPHLDAVEKCVIDMDHREDAFHLGTYVGEELAAIGSFFQMDSSKLSITGMYRLRAMATSPAFRGKHAGQNLLLFAFEELRRRHIPVLWCDARLNAVGFYESLGFLKKSEIYEVPLIGPHQFMWIELQ